MSTIAQISPNSVAARPIDVNPSAQAAQNASLAATAQTSAKTVQQSRTDTVTISSQALKLAAQLEKSPPDGKGSFGTFNRLN